MSWRACEDQDNVCMSVLSYLTSPWWHGSAPLPIELFCLPFKNFFLRQGLTIQPRLVLNSQSSCFRYTVRYVGYFLGMVLLCSSGWPDFMIVSPQHLEGWVYRCEALHLADDVFFISADSPASVSGIRFVYSYCSN